MAGLDLRRQIRGDLRLIGHTEPWLRGRLGHLKGLHAGRDHLIADLKRVRALL